jgi:hypothetical protein
MRHPDFVIGRPGDWYLERWHLIPRNPVFNVYLHHFLRSDDDRALHDHPWWNMSVLLRGSYVEVMPGNRRVVRWPFRPVCRRASSAHRVELIAGRPVWTLFFTGPRIRAWGFHCPQGWRHWHDFVAETDEGNAVGPGCD